MTNTENTSEPRAMWSWDRTLTGVVAALISPVDDAGGADTAAVTALVEHILAGGCAGLFAVGGSGEGPWLSMSQRAALIRAVVKAANERVPVLAGALLPSSALASEAARQAEAEGAAAVVVGSPYYYEVDGADQRRHVEAVLSAVDLPVLLYNVPQCTHHTLKAETVAALAREPRVLGIKDSAGDLQAFQDFLAVKDERPDFRVLQGNEHAMAASLLLGGDGLVPGLANVAPRLFVDLLAAATAGDVPGCRQLQRQIEDLWTLHLQGQSLPALKAACGVLGIGSGSPVPPCRAVSADQEHAISAILRRHGLLGRRLEALGR